MAEQIKTQQVCKDFLRMYCKGIELDAMQATLRIREVWGIRVDWHEFVNAFEHLVRSEEATMTQGWGHCKYIIN